MRSPPLEVLRRPPQGWVSLLLFLGMLSVVALSIADARPLAFIDGGPELTGSLVVVMITAGLMGFVLGRSTLGIVRSHIIGALAGAMILLMMVGAAVQGASGVLLLDIDALGARIASLSAELQANVDAWLVSPDAIPVAATLLVLGAICWTTGQFGAFSIFRYDRGGPAVMSTGVLLFLNVATKGLAAPADLLPLVPMLAVYSALAMVLLIRLQLVHQSEHWARRHIADTGEVARLFMRTGTLFVMLAVLGASSLTAIAVARPPSIDMDELSEPLQDLGENVSQWLSFFAVPTLRNEATTFGEDFPILDKWEQIAGTAFAASVEGGLRGNYWWGAAFDNFDGKTWSQSISSEADLSPNELLPMPSVSGQRPPVSITAVITADDSALARGTVMGVAQASTVDRKVEFKTIGESSLTDEAALADITFARALETGDSYVVRSLGHDYQENSSTLTANQLRNASTDYPPELLERYTHIATGTTGGRTAKKKNQALLEAMDTNPYDLALWLQEDFQAMDYVTNLADFGGCGNRQTAECLLEFEQGFCQQFATTMIMVLRELQIPSRIVNGYLPGPIKNGQYEVPTEALHSWVEVYFPGFGWVRFDPTPVRNADGLQQSVTNFAPGPDIEDLPESPFAGESPGPEFAPEPTLDPALAAGVVDDGALPPSDEGFGGRALTIGGLAALAAFILFAIVLLRVRRLPSADAGLAYRGIVSLASRLGYGPHPSQTEYEYASALSETLPSVREDLYVVAAARVESAYGRRTHEGARLAALKRSYARIRTALLRLTLRRR